MKAEGKRGSQQTGGQDTRHKQGYDMKLRFSM